MKIEVVGYNYLPSKSFLAQGSKLEIQKLVKKGYRIVRGGNGSYIMSDPSIAEIEYKINDDEKVHTQNAKPLVREYYGVDKVTETRLKNFVSDCIYGAVNLKYSETDGLYL
jgi:hypothetical protein